MTLPPLGHLPRAGIAALDTCASGPSAPATSRARPCFAQSQPCSRPRQAAPVGSRAEKDVCHQATVRPVLSACRCQCVGGGTRAGVTGPGCRAPCPCSRPARDVFNRNAAHWPLVHLCHENACTEGPVSKLVLTSSWVGKGKCRCWRPRHFNFNSVKQM